MSLHSLHNMPQNVLSSSRGLLHQFPGLLPKELLNFTAYLVYMVLMPPTIIFTGHYPNDSMPMSVYLEIILIFLLPSLFSIPRNFLNYISQYFSHFNLAPWHPRTWALYRRLSLGNPKVSDNIPI